MPEATKPEPAPTLRRRSITDAEWLIVMHSRAVALTGKPVHIVSEFAATVAKCMPVEFVGQFYCWDWGRQPDGDTLACIVGVDPVKAAHAFLRWQAHNNGGNAAALELKSTGALK